MTPLQKLPENVGDLGKLIVAKGFKNFQKSNKSPNMVTLLTIPTRLLHVTLNDFEWRFMPDGDPTLHIPWDSFKVRKMFAQKKKMCF